MKKILILLVILTLLVITGCIPNFGESDHLKGNEKIQIGQSGAINQNDAISGKRSLPTSRIEERSTLSTSSTIQTGVTESSDPSNRKIILISSIELEVKKFDQTYETITNIANKFEGFIANSNSWIDYNKVKRGTITLKIPSKSLSEVESEISNLGKIKSKSRSGNDVTETYIDIESRLNQAKKSESRLLVIMDKTETVEEILSVERELNRIRQQIESYQSRLNYFNKNIEMSSLTVNLHEPESIVEQFNIIKSLKTAINNFIKTILWLIELLGILIPLVIIAIGAWWSIKKLRKKSK